MPSLRDHFPRRPWDIIAAKGDFSKHRDGPEYWALRKKSIHFQKRNVKNSLCTHTRPTQCLSTIQLKELEREKKNICEWNKNTRSEKKPCICFVIVGGTVRRLMTEKNELNQCQDECEIWQNVQYFEGCENFVYDLLLGGNSSALQCHPI